MAQIQVVNTPILPELLPTGPRGAKGWTPTFAIVADGVRRVIAVDWQGGIAPKPAVGYLGTTGVVANKAQAADVAYADVITAAADVATKYPAILNAAVQAAASAEEAGDLVGQAAEIVFAGSTDFPLQPPTSYWHCDMGEIEPTIDLSYTGQLSVFDRQGVLRSVPAAARPLNYDPVTKACLGFPLWEGVTNKIPTPADLNGAFWSKLGATVAAATVDGIATQKLVEDSSTGAHQNNVFNLTVSAGVAETVQVVAKAGERTKMRLAFVTAAIWPNSQNPTAEFDLITGTATNILGTVTSAIKALGNGEYLCSITATPTTTSAGSGIAIIIVNGAAISYAGDGASGLYLRRPMLASNGFVAPFTEGARGNMLPSISGRAFQRDFGTSEGTLVVEFLKDTSNTKTATLAHFWDTAGVRVMWLEVSPSNSFLLRNYIAATATYLNIPVTGLVNGRNKAAFSYKNGRMAISLNGGAVASNTQVSLPNALNRFDFGFAGYLLNNHIRERISYNYVVDDAHLVALSRL